MLNCAQKFTPQERNTFALYRIFSGLYSFSPCQEENGAPDAYRLCSVVYVCDNVKIKGLGRPIFEFISATLF